MFVKTEERPHGEPQKVGTLKLSEAIRIGIKSVPNSASFCGCAMGAGYYALTGGRNLEEAQRMEMQLNSGKYGDHIVAELTGVPFYIVHHASRKHHVGQWSREQCADWIEEQGY